MRTRSRATPVVSAVFARVPLASFLEREHEIIRNGKHIRWYYQWKPMLLPQGSIAKIRSSCSDMLASAKGAPHLRFRTFALLAYFFGHTRSLTHRSSAVWGAPIIPLL